MEAINEVYFGKSAIAPLQEQLSKVRVKLQNKPVTPTTNFDSEIIKFNRLAEKIFGFVTFSLYIQPDNSPNAYAFPVDIYLSDSDKKKIYNSMTASSEGFKYDKSMAKVSMVIAIHTGLFDCSYITDEEIMGVLLHEIGHGFFEAVTNKDCKYSNSRKLISIFKSINKMALDRIKQGKGIIDAAIEKEVNFVTNFFGNLKLKFDSIKNQLFVHESMDQNMRSNRIAYTNEKFADTFAAMYGYGNEVHSALVKMYQNLYKEYHGIKKYPKIIETIKMYNLYLNDLIAYTLNLQDEHPGQLARVQTTIDYIKKELSKEGLDPKLKKELLAELQRVNQLVEDFINFPRDEDSMRILRLYYIKLYKKFGGDRREQDTDNNALFDTIDNRYNETK